MASPPLTGRTVVVTRAVEQAGPFVEQLRALGAVVLEVPLIQIVDPSDGGKALVAAVVGLRAYDWVVLTSPNAAQRFVAAAFAHATVGIDDMPSIAVVGPGTAAVITGSGLDVALISDRAIGEGLVASFPSGCGRVLLPRAAVTRDVVPEGLRAKGWQVDVVDAYRTEPVPADPALGIAVRSADAIAFTSSSTVRAFVSWYGVTLLPAVVVSIGPETTATLTAAGAAVAITASPHTLDGLLRALCVSLDPAHPKGGEPST